MPQRILIRKDILSNWVSNNPILGDGEISYVKDTRMFKVGNGSSNWVSLEYASPTPIATEYAFGGIKAKARTSESYEVSIDISTGRAYVREPDEAIVLSLWKSTVSYPLNAICHIGGKLYKSNIPNNLGINPESTVGFWENIKSGMGGGEGEVDLTYSIRRFRIEPSPLLLGIESRSTYDETLPPMNVISIFHSSYEEPNGIFRIVDEMRTLRAV